MAVQKPKALIVGSRGQDGTYLRQVLARNGFEVWGWCRQGVYACEQPQNIIPWQLTHQPHIPEVVKKMRPQQIYYLAGVHHSSEGHEGDRLDLLQRSTQIHVLSLGAFLEALIHIDPEIKFFYAASSHIFGHPEETVQDEKTPMRPTSIYGMTKLMGMELCQMYRSNFGLRASVGILYNHESPLRAETFLTQKVIHSALQIKKGQQSRLVLGNPTAVVDWGYAPEYTEAMFEITQLAGADDFVIASGRGVTVKEFVTTVFEKLGLSWDHHVEIKPETLTRNLPILVGNPQKLKRATGWEAKTGPEGLVKILLAAHPLLPERKPHV